MFLPGTYQHVFICETLDVSRLNPALVYGEKMEVRKWALSRVRYWWNQLHLIYGNVKGLEKIPKIEFSERMTRTAGLAFSKQKLIRLSLPLLRQQKADFDETIAHELVHIWADIMWHMDCGHGFRWRKVMINLGLTPTRCHSYPKPYTFQFDPSMLPKV